MNIYAPFLTNALGTALLTIQSMQMFATELNEKIVF